MASLTAVIFKMQSDGITMIDTENRISLSSKLQSPKMSPKRMFGKGLSIRKSIQSNDEELDVERGGNRVSPSVGLNAAPQLSGPGLT